MSTASPLVALVNGNRVWPPVAPIALDYLENGLRAANFRVRILDLCLVDDWREEIIRFTQLEPVDYWGLTIRNTDDVYFAGKRSFLEQTTEVVNALRKSAPCPVIVGGVGFSVMPEAILRLTGADYGIVRDGEESFPSLLSKLELGLPVDHIPGLVFRNAGSVIVNSPIPADISRVARSRSLVDNPEYYRLGGMAAVETKRGCNRRCIHCVEPYAKGATLTFREPSAIADEVEALLERGCSVFHINDSEFNLNVEHCQSVLREFTDRNFGERVRWYAYGMPAPFPKSLASAMVDAGCAGMNFGIDSASDQILARVRRTFRKRHIASAVQTCKEVGLRYMLEVLIGFPGETPETAAETISFLEEVDADLVFVTVGIRIFPNTQMADIVRCEGLDDNENLRGPVDPDFIHPTYYISSALGADPVALVRDLVGNDRRFLSINGMEMNYVSNSTLVEAISKGHRGAYWDILQRIAADR